MKLVISGKAKRDLLRIYSYISQHNPDAAIAILERINERLGATCPVSVIFYFAEADRIRIVRVIDGRMDIDEEFRR
jgi:toxin ParE1/3/4